jgi:hypothetical protein
LLNFKVDGYDKNTNTILGDYWHGNPEKFNTYDIHPRVKKSFGELYNLTFNKFKILKDNGYNIKYIWEKDWDDWVRNPTHPIPIKEYN